MGFAEDQNQGSNKKDKGGKHVPLPSAQFRRRAWSEFQRSLDPLAPPKPLRPPQH
jgi:hypothetical protein